jgi:hypothetical protein
VTLSGQQLLQKVNDERETMEVNVSSVVKGAYLLKMQRRDGVEKVLKVIKE